MFCPKERARQPRLDQVEPQGRLQQQGPDRRGKGSEKEEKPISHLMEGSVFIPSHSIFLPLNPTDGRNKGGWIGEDIKKEDPP